MFWTSPQGMSKVVRMSLNGEDFLNLFEAFRNSQLPHCKACKIMKDFELVRNWN